MKRLFAALLLIIVCCAIQASAQDSTVVFQEPGFPTADTAVIPAGMLAQLFPTAKHAGANDLEQALSTPKTSLLVMPYGSAFPESTWGDISSFLSRGGNLLVIGGKPFTRAAYKTQSGWQLREYSVRFIHELLIDQYQPTPGSDGLKFETNPDVVTQPAAFHWKQGFTPVIRLSAYDIYKRGGSAGTLDSRLDPLAWGVKDGQRLSSPVMQIDHVRGPFIGGRWVSVSSELSSEFYSSGEASRLIPALISAALRGSQEFTARPTLPLYLPGEPVQVELEWINPRNPSASLSAEVTLISEEKPNAKSTKTVALTNRAVVTFPGPVTKGLHFIEARLKDRDSLLAIYRSAFWTRDEAYLQSGPKLGVNTDYFELDGKPLAVIGTTYMGSDVQRLFFDHPNVFIWNRDMAQMSYAGINMIRTGWWTGWDKLCDESGRPYDRTLRTLEAYLMTARKYGIPVQLNIFAFLPDSLGGINAYLDPEAIRRQKQLVTGVAERFHDVPFLAWDLINEPSNSQTLWRMRPNGDTIESARWNEWLQGRYPDRTALAHAWNLPSTGGGTLPVPSPGEYEARAMYSGVNSIKLYDYFLFAQQTFADWAMQMRAAIRNAGAQQLITVGQDEGGYIDRVSPAFFGNAVDFTTNHSWWQNDNLLWDSLVAKQPGKAMLIQETGLQRELTLDELARRTVDSEASLFERKVALSFVQGSGAIQWLWHTNTYMTESNEVAIGALRADATEKPEATVMRGFAAFAIAASSSLKAPEPPPVAIITSQAAQSSPIGTMQVEAQRKAVRALAYENHISPYIVPENQIQKLGNPKLAILPSPQALSETAWQMLLKYVEAGGNLLVTGPVGRDPHWHEVDRMAGLNLGGTIEPLTFRTAELRAGDQAIPMSFGQDHQMWLEAVRFTDAGVLKQVPLGKGRIFWAAYPVELADGTDAASELYAYVLQTTGVRPLFELQHELSPGVLVYATPLQDAILYVMESEDARDTTVDLNDKLTGAHLKVPLQGEHAALVVISRRDGAVLAKYGF